jgi:hypothetical protein
VDLAHAIADLAQGGRRALGCPGGDGRSPAVSGWRGPRSGLPPHGYVLWAAVAVQGGSVGSCCLVGGGSYLPASLPVGGARAR